MHGAGPHDIKDAAVKMLLLTIAIGFLGAVVERYALEIAIATIVAASYFIGVRVYKALKASGRIE